MTPTRWYLPFFMPSTALVLLIALGLTAWWVSAWRARRAGTVSVKTLSPGGGPWRIARRAAQLLTTACAALLLVAALPATATYLAKATESPHRPVDPSSVEQADCIVVLSGAIFTTVGPDGRIHTRVGAAQDRFDTGVRAFRAGRAPRIAFGSGVSRVEGALTEGPWSRERAIDLGIPEDAIIIGSDAWYTSDEAAHLANALHARGVKSIILCSSAFHLNRAIPHYQRLGFRVIPLPCHFLTAGEAVILGWRDFLPSARALDVTDLCVKEWLGRAALTSMKFP